MNASEFLEQEPEFKGRLSFERKRFWVISNDRLNLPNTDQSFEQLRSALAEIAVEFFGHDHFILSRHGGRKEPLNVLVESTTLN